MGTRRTTMIRPEHKKIVGATMAALTRVTEETP
jgi:hypothetical protein